MRGFLRVNAGLLIIEGLILVGVSIYWDYLVPDDARMIFFGRAYAKARAVGFVGAVGAWLCVVGAVVYLLMRFAGWMARRSARRDGEQA